MKKVNKSLSLRERIGSPSPTFFKRIRNIGLTIGAIGAALLAAPIALPPLISTLA